MKITIAPLRFVAGSLLMFGVGMILSGTLALLPSMMQVLMNYPVFDAGWMMAPRGFGTMLAMFMVARLIDRVDNRLFILVGFLLTAASLWQMTGYSLYMGRGPSCSLVSPRVSSLIDSPLERNGFEPLVPRKRENGFESAAGSRSTPVASRRPSPT
jgi:MFS transporter, DHA2 family, multidrug resistance protein